MRRLSRSPKLWSTLLAGLTPPGIRYVSSARFRSADQVDPASGSASDRTGPTPFRLIDCGARRNSCCNRCAAVCAWSPRSALATSSTSVWAKCRPSAIDRNPIGFSPDRYRSRNLVERFFNKITQRRRIATRYDKLAANHLASIKLASIRIWLRAYESRSGPADAR